MKFIINVEAHTGPNGRVPFLAREATAEEERLVRYELRALVARLNMKNPLLYLDIEEES